MLDYQLQTLTLLSSASILKLISAIRSKVALKAKQKLRVRCVERWHSIRRWWVSTNHLKVLWLLIGEPFTIYSLKVKLYLGHAAEIHTVFQKLTEHYTSSEHHGWQELQTILNPPLYTAQSPTSLPDELITWCAWFNNTKVSYTCGAPTQQNHIAVNRHWQHLTSQSTHASSLLWQNPGESSSITTWGDARALGQNAATRVNCYWCRIESFLTGCKSVWFSNLRTYDQKLLHRTVRTALKSSAQNQTFHMMDNSPV